MAKIPACFVANRDAKIPARITVARLRHAVAIRPETMSSTGAMKS